MQGTTDKVNEKDTTIGKDIYDKIEENPSMLDLADIKALLLPNGDVEFTMKVEYRHTNVYGVVHGGIFATLLDTAMGFSCFYSGDDRRVMTINMNVSFVGNCPEGVIIKTTGRPIHSGKRTMVTEGEIFDEYGKLLATAQGTFFVLDKEDKRLVMPGSSSTIN